MMEEQYINHIIKAYMYYFDYFIGHSSNLKSNTFEFNGQLLNQVGGVGTGMKLSPTYAYLGGQCYNNGVLLLIN